MKKSNQNGFTIIEMVVIVAILTTILIIAVPNLTKGKRAAQSASAVSSMRTIVTCELVHSQNNHRFVDFNLLNSYGCLDVVLTSGVKSGYTFTINIPPDEQSFTLQAHPNDARSESMYLFADQTGVIRFKYGSPADGSSVPIPQ